MSKHAERASPLVCLLVLLALIVASWTGVFLVVRGVAALIAEGLL